MIFFPYEWQTINEYKMKYKFKAGDLVNIHDMSGHTSSGMGIVMCDKVKGGSESLFPYMKVYIFDEYRTLEIHIGALRIISTTS
jgi:hypothetical protein